MIWLALVSGGFVGFAVGLFAFKVKNRWCPEHGWPLSCPECRIARQVRS